MAKGLLTWGFACKSSGESAILFLRLFDGYSSYWLHNFYLFTPRTSCEYKTCGVFSAVISNNFTGLCNSMDQTLASRKTSII